MHRPIAAPFHGSTPAEAVLDADFVQTLNLSFGALSILASAATWAAIHFARPELDVRFALAASSMVLLVCALIGHRMVQEAGDVSKNTAGRIYDAVFRRVAQPGWQAIKSTPVHGSFDGVAGLIGDLVLLARRLRTARARERLSTATLGQALQDGRQQAQSVASSIRQNAGDFAEAAAAVHFTGERVAREMAGATRSLAVAETGMDQAARKLNAVGGSVRTIITHAQQMTSVTIDISRITHAARQGVTVSDAKTTALLSAMNSIEQALRRAAAHGMSSSIEVPAPRAGSAGDWTAIRALQQVAGECGPALDTVRSVVGELIAGTADANRRTIEVGNLMLTIRDIGEAIGHAVQQQGEEVAQILDGVYKAREGFVILKTAVESVAQVGTSNQDAAQLLRLTASRLPDQAERLAGLLRNVPKVVPSDY